MYSILDSPLIGAYYVTGVALVGAEVGYTKLGL